MVTDAAPPAHAQCATQTCRDSAHAQLCRRPEGGHKRVWELKLEGIAWLKGEHLEHALALRALHVVLGPGVWKAQASTQRARAALVNNIGGASQMWTAFMYHSLNVRVRERREQEGDGHALELGAGCKEQVARAK